ncbi:adenosylcobinamide-GDP ribazoletransferase [Streptococcus cuniculi]|uniref:Adenosylcobinamide-GDP ribazoletransferase n=1 Tax=Streptococcus cuniculi TaxID=1432788 RepID=A0A4Y9JFL0_9STRE|nr:adenosylcobinamide-GDP ribazoletransferase [Streptococcus cuniculi]MBF0777624.1 adenosylcobinamide-GDP ribazoletransferase [Streptococcus cuniculi]TFU98664.1 adenosylcobinamide-GDP ribazoletransferase [Streptococcus cuniculi]
MIQSLIIYTQFFSRIVIHKEVDLVYVRKGIPIITLFGLLLGSLSALFYYLIQLVLPDMVAWVLTLLFDVLLTGGFHLDGLADMADGLFSSRNKERMLEIMKDSRIGSNGVLALILYYGLMMVAFPYLPKPKWLIVASLTMIGKAGLALQLYHMTYARATGGSGQFFAGTTVLQIALAQVLPILVLGVGFGVKGLLGYALVFLGAIFYRQFVYGKIGGHTGDTLGAFVEISQILLLLGLML